MFVTFGVHGRYFAVLVTFRIFLGHLMSIGNGFQTIGIVVSGSESAAGDGFIQS
jgi:hypothetical protein